MKVKVIRSSDEHVLNVRYTDELLDAGILKDEAELEEAERCIKTNGVYYVNMDMQLRRA